MKIRPPLERDPPPCFGLPHRGFFKCTSICQLGMNVICFGLGINDIVFFTKQWNSQADEMTEDEKRNKFLRPFAWFVFFLQFTISTVLDLLMFIKANNVTSVFHLRAFTMHHWIICPVELVLYYTLQVYRLRAPRREIRFLFPGYLFYRIGISYIVHRYATEIQYDLKMKSGYRDLSNGEIQEFEDGLLDEEAGQMETCIYEKAKYLRYRREEFEIPKDDIDFGDSSTLGFGEYGHVYKAHWLRKCNRTGNIDKTPVAVKTVDPELSDVHHFMALLGEAKVMTYIGKHKNIVELIGLCTMEIRTRKLYIVCELCAFGNLRTYLRSERANFVNLFQDEEGDLARDDSAAVVVQVEEKHSSLDTNDLIKWSIEIACGMEYLQSQKVVHGDLAARNVLLTETKTAKITDFGLSRRLYNYSVYVKRNNAPLPWRWLAIESLVDMNFSSQSDVWAFGVLCWEIFELGAVPWPEIQEFTCDFIQNVRQGKRMDKPRFCTKEIYQFLLTCWDEEPKKRPSFSDIASFFQEIFPLCSKFSAQEES